jgi:hypothetical protein
LDRNHAVKQIAKQPNLTKQPTSNPAKTFGWQFNDRGQSKDNASGNCGHHAENRYAIGRDVFIGQPVGDLVRPSRIAASDRSTVFRLVRVGVDFGAF